jgi:hypothetical protein
MNLSFDGTLLPLRVQDRQPQRRDSLPLSPATLGPPARSRSAQFWPLMIVEHDGVTQSPVRRCMSPERLYKCEGDCLHEGPGDKAHVVSPYGSDICL